MLRSDIARNITNDEVLMGYANSLNYEVIAEVEKELRDNPYDMISLVFILYDVPETALQRLIVYQRVSKDAGYINTTLLQEWYQHAKSKQDWKLEFLEALTICQLYAIIKKLGFNVDKVKKIYQPQNMNVYLHIHPLKKALYLLCENIDSNNLIKIKKSLCTYHINTTDYETCEMVFLKLMCQKFITVTQPYNEQKNTRYNMEIENLVKIIDKLPALRRFCIELKNLQSMLTNEPALDNPNTSTFASLCLSENKSQDRLWNNHDYDDVFDLLNKVCAEDDSTNSAELRPDTTKTKDTYYEIKNNKKVGLCIIINEEDFYPSRGSIMSNESSLEQRFGSRRDQIVLEKTMSTLNFDVKSFVNLNHKEIFQCIKDEIKKRNHCKDSIFMLCILSHGIRGHIYASDSVKVKVEDIQHLLDSDDVKHIHGLPKVIIIQACQVDAVFPDLVADSPKPNYFLKKVDFLIYWATAPEYEAYRHEEKGSIFIQSLCKIIKQDVKKEHLYDIFTQVTKYVTNLCTRLQRAQVPLLESTLRKKIFLNTPEYHNKT